MFCSLLTGLPVLCHSVLLTFDDDALNVCYCCLRGIEYWHRARTVLFHTAGIVTGSYLNAQYDLMLM